MIFTFLVKNTVKNNTLTLKETVLKVKDFKGWFLFKNKIMTMVPDIRMKCITL